MSSWLVLFVAGVAYLFGRLRIFESKRKSCSCPETKGQAYREIFSGMHDLRRAVSDIALAQAESGDDAEQLMKSARSKYWTANLAYTQLHNSLVFLFPEEFTNTTMYLSDWDLKDAWDRQQHIQEIIQEAIMIARKDVWTDLR